MISIKGDYYDGKTSRKIPTSLEIYDNGEVKLSHQGNRDVVALSTLHISSRVGNTPRYIRFPDGGKFETGDNDAVDKALARFRRQSWERILHLFRAQWEIVRSMATAAGAALVSGEPLQDAGI